MNLVEYRPLNIFIQANQFLLMKVRFDPYLGHPVSQCRTELLFAEIPTRIHGCNHLEFVMTDYFNSLLARLFTYHQCTVGFEHGIQAFQYRIVCETDLINK